ncbi:MAG TPA: hypothetical protein VFE46_19425 [Pirellulales bacterium]|jgi:hypothetical protein|nr:hypothetical protein [Pirellulales bacterium]
MISRIWFASIAVGFCLSALGNPGRLASAQDVSSANGRQTQPPLFGQLDEAQVRAAGIRKLESRRLVLYTDLASTPDVDELPQVFDQAFDLWCKYFGLDPARYPDWKMRASVIDNPARFTEAGLMPADLPKFLNGYTRGHECWLYNQSIPYYRSHLLLHEGVHGIMFSLLGSHAPPWYMEGMAELLGTHHWQNGKLELPYFPKKIGDVSGLGRIELVQKDVAAGLNKHLSDVMAYDNLAHLHVEPYAWSWAAAAFLDGHPKYRDKFRQMQARLKTRNNFNAELVSAYGDEFPQLEQEWKVFIADLDYGYDFARTALNFMPGEPLGSQPRHVTVQADRGWQNSAVRLEAGKTYKLAASGRFQVANDPKPWISEPNGVSIRYIHGRPMGVLLAAVYAKDSTHQENSFAKPLVVGYGTTITPVETGTLFLRINDSSGELTDNAGQVEVNITMD